MQVDKDMKYQRIIQPYSQSFFLFGARGTGKSTWLRDNYGEALYIDLLDEVRFQTYLADPGQFASEVRAMPEGSWVVVDEIQRLPNLLNEVHRAIERGGYRFALSGSSFRKLKRSGVNLLAGRAVLKTMHPFLPCELGQDFDLDEALQSGTIPTVWQAEDKTLTLESYAQLYLREEIQAEALVRNLPSFARFLPVAALMHGQVLNISGLARDCGSHRNTVSGYIEILEDTLLAFRLPGYEAKLRMKERKHPKLYFIDPGLVRALKKNTGRISIEEKGALFEGWIAALLQAHNAYRNIFDDWYYWSSSESKAEVDFLLRRSGSFVAIEVKSSKTISKQDLKGLKAISTLKGLEKRMVVYPGESKQKTESGIEILPLRTFLEELEKGLFG